MKDKESRLFFTLSNKTRIEILKVLSNNESSLSQISQKTNSSPQIIQRHVRLLNDNSLIDRNANGMYIITDAGHNALIQSQSIEFLSKTRGYFADHTLGDAPIQFSHRIGSLANSEYVDGIAPCFTRWKKIIENADEFLYCIFTQPPILIAENILEKISKGVRFQIIFGKNSIIEECNEFAEKLYLKTNHSPFEFEKRMVDEVAINMLVSEKDACLMFPYKNDTTDMHRIFVSSDREFCGWCLDFFDYKWKDGEPFSKLRIGNLSDYP